eukprot:gene833-492_t
MSALQAGEESETDSEDGEVQVPQVNSDAIQAGEESETDSEEDDGGTGASAAEGGEEEEDEADDDAVEGGGGGGSSVGGGGGTGFITWRHKKLSETNKSLRKGYVSRIRRCPRTLSKHLNDVGAQLNKQQAAAQDVSDSLRMLNQDMLEVKGRLVFTSVDFLPSITVPCMSIRSTTLAKIKAMTLAETTQKPDFTTLEWPSQNSMKMKISQFGHSEVIFSFRPGKFLPAGAEGCGAPLTPGLAVSEINRKVHPLHLPFFDKAYTAIIDMLGVEDHLTRA